MEIYGFRGTLLLVSGISLQSIVGTALMQPVEWHMKKVEVPEDKENGILVELLTSYKVLYGQKYKNILYKSFNHIFLESKLLLRSEENPRTCNEDTNMIKPAEDAKNFNKGENVKGQEPSSFIK